MFLKATISRAQASIAIAAIMAVALLAFEARAADAAEPEIHYAPVENLEHIDLALIRSATKSVDMAAYSLADWAIVIALKEVRDRGVTIRIVLDPSQRQAYDRLAGMADSVRVKRGRLLMHLKAYAVDGAILRTGSANFSGGGLKDQDNDLIILRDPAAAEKFEARFAKIYSAAGAYDRCRTAEPRRDENGNQPTDSACPIKGNVNGKGDHIYFEVGDRAYKRVTMKECDQHGMCAKGKRCFQSAAEAVAAGWKRSNRWPRRATVPELATLVRRGDRSLLHRQGQQQAGTRLRLLREERGPASSSHGAPLSPYRHARSATI
jgi:hypothetical protein